MKIMILQKWLSRTSLSRGGSETQISFISREMARREQKVLLWTTTKPDTKIFPELLDVKNLEIVKCSKSSYSYLDLLNQIKEMKPNVLYSRETRGLFFYCLIGKLTGVPLVFHINIDQNRNPFSIYQLLRILLFGTLLLSKDPAYNEWYSVNRRILKTKKKRIIFPDWAIISYLNSKIYGGLSQLLVQTKKQKSFFEEKGFSPKVVCNAHSFPLEILEKHSPPIVLWVANFRSGLKRPEMFISLAESLNDTNAKFVMVGKNYSDSRSKNIIASVRKLKNLTYLGPLPFDTVNHLFSQSSVFVNTSWSEGFPNTYIQSWSNEVPVVSLEVDCQDLLKEEKGGFLSNSFENMCDDVRKLITDNSLRQRIGKQAWVSAMKNFQIEKVGKNYIRTFQSVSLNRGKN